MIKEDFTLLFCEGLVKIHGSVQAASRACFGRVSHPTIPGHYVSARSIERWIYKALHKQDQDNGDKPVLAGVPVGEGVPASERVTRRTSGTYEVVRRNVNGEPTVFQLRRECVSTVPEVPNFPIRNATPSTIVYNPGPRILRSVRYGVVVSDVQFGFLKNTQTGELEPSHDPRALSVAKRIVSDICPASLFFIGDFVDWPTFSRWQKYPEYYGVIQPTIDGAHQELGEIIAAAGTNCTRRIMVGSNHQQRPEKFLLEHNMEALSIRRANRDRVQSNLGWPVFSEQYLLRYDDLGIEFSGQYPGGEYWVNDGLVLTHAPAKKLEFAADNIHGHTHKLTTTTWTQFHASGRKNFYQYDCGCLCQMGSTTNKQSLHLTRVPSDRARTDWSQGIAVISQLDGKFPKHEVELIKIDRGCAIYRGQVYDENS